MEREKILAGIGVENGAEDRTGTGLALKLGVSLGGSWGWN